MRKYKIVPVEPTEDMQDAWADCDHEETAHGDWKVMLAAAPPVSQDEELVEKVARVICGVPDDAVAWVHFTEEARAVLKVLEADHG